MAVLRFQATGVGHHPPEGDHTYIMIRENERDGIQELVYGRKVNIDFGGQGQPCRQRQYIIMKDGISSSPRPSMTHMCCC